MSAFMNLVEKLVAVCIVGTLLECAVGEDEAMGPMRLLCGLYVSAGCIQVVTGLVKEFLCR